MTLVRPAAWVDPSVKLGAEAVVQAGSTIGRHAIVNTSASVDHDSVVQDFAHITPGDISPATPS